MKKNNDGIKWKRGEDRKLVYYWQIGNVKSKTFSGHAECAQEYIAKYVEQYPKYKELVYDKTWDQLFAMFGIKIQAQTGAQ